jgi:hypothetical protein
MISLKKSVSKILKPNYVFNFSTAKTSDDLQPNEHGKPTDAKMSKIDLTTSIFNRNFNKTQLIELTDNENTIVDLDQKENEKSSTPASFAKLFRNSTFTNLGIHSN